jgi:hypothetical protein
MSGEFRVILNHVFYPVFDAGLSSGMSECRLGLTTKNIGLKPPLT